MLAARTERPIGVSIFSVLHVIGGLAALGLLGVGVSLRNDAKVQEALVAIGIPFAAIAFGIGFLGLLGIVAGVAMWRGAKWGWYLASFYYAYAIVRNANALATISQVFQLLPDAELADMSRGPGYYYVKFGGRLVVSILLYSYFFKQNVREFFGIEDNKRWEAAIVQFAICIGIALAMTAWTRFGG
jgi:hypothetical protein